MLTINTFKPNNYCKNKISFGTMEREVTDPEFRRLDDFSNIKWRNNTYLFRKDLAWGIVANHIAKDGKPKRIYCYACSDGSEPYSIAIALIYKLGFDKAQKYFPIIARDKDEFVIEKAKSGNIKLKKSDLFVLKVFEKITKMKFLDNAAAQKSPEEYSLSKELKSCVDFGLGDLLKDKDSLEYDNAVIFFRNVWPYLSKQEQVSLVKTFKNNFTKDSSLIIGDFDFDNNAHDNYFQMFPEEIVDFGLWQVKPRIFQTHDIDFENLNPKDNLKILRHMFTEKYCQMINLIFKNYRIRNRNQP